MSLEACKISNPEWKKSGNTVQRVKFVHIEIASMQLRTSSDKFAVWLRLASSDLGSFLVLAQPAPRLRHGGALSSEALHVDRARSGGGRGARGRSFLRLRFSLSWISQPKMTN